MVNAAVVKTDRLAQLLLLPGLNLPGRVGQSLNITEPLQPHSCSLTPNGPPSPSPDPQVAMTCHRPSRSLDLLALPSGRPLSSLTRPGVHLHPQALRARLSVFLSSSPSTPWCPEHLSLPTPLSSLVSPLLQYPLLGETRHAFQKLPLLFWIPFIALVAPTLPAHFS